MAAQSKRGGAWKAPARPATPTLPPVTVARFEEAAKLIERLLEEQQDTLLKAAQRYRERHRETTSRGLNAIEAAQVAAGLMRSDVEAAVLVQRSDLRAYDDPSVNEVFIAAGVATAPAFLDACSRLVALIEMTPTVFEEAYEAGTLDTAIEEARDTWGTIEMTVARARATAALDHFAKAGGAGSAGEAVRLLVQMAMQAHQQTVLAMTPSPLSSLTGSPPNTDGPAEPSSTTSPTATP